MKPINRIIKEEIQNIFEVGEGNLLPYPYELKNSTFDIILKFKTEDNDVYEVDIYRYYDDVWNVEFNVNGLITDINKNKQYRVMSTILDIIKKFVNAKNPLALTFSGSKTKGDNDYRRDNMYIAYIAKHITDNYELIKGELGYTIRKKYNNTIINNFKNSEGREKEAYTKVYDELSNISKITEQLHEETIEISNDPNTLSFYHGGNLDRYDDTLSQKKGRYEYGAGLYLTTHYETAAKYAKGSRKMYLIIVNKGNDINKMPLIFEKAKSFINTYASPSMRKEIINALLKYNKDGNIPAYIFNNLLNNYQAIKPAYTKYVRQFYIDNNIDYDIVDNPFGWGEQMMILYNMKKIAKTIIIKPTDKIKDYLINNETNQPNN
jgi:hypothetical protein